MRRLTERLSEFSGTLDEIAFINPHDREGAYNLKEIVRWSEDFYLYKIANRLAAYEDTGLTPKEVKKLAADRAHYKRAFEEVCRQFNYGGEKDYKDMRDAFLRLVGVPEDDEEEAGRR